jgi:hypothetical protein
MFIADDVYSEYATVRSTNPMRSNELRNTAERAHRVAKCFEPTITVDFLESYLEDQLPFDSLSQLHLASNASYCEPGTNSETCMFSKSHALWLSELSKFKLDWSRTQGDGMQRGPMKKVTTDANFQKLYTNYNDIQSIALSYPLGLEEECMARYNTLQN